ncbi:MAG: NAD(P)(+) transhydrogenase (Re/Si-specific) subunit alpha, partial [Chitinophagaceae bacterium]
MIIGVLKEPVPETRVSLLAEAVSALTKKGCEVWVEPGAGVNSFCTDDAYVQAGASIKALSDILSGANIVLSIQQPAQPPVAGAVLIGMYQALLHKEK